jgi:hypothetical protein
VCPPASAHLLRLFRVRRSAAPRFRPCIELSFRLKSSLMVSKPSAPKHSHKPLRCRGWRSCFATRPGYLGSARSSQRPLALLVEVRGAGSKAAVTAKFFTVVLRVLVWLLLPILCTPSSRRASDCALAEQAHISAALEPARLCLLVPPTRRARHRHERLGAQPYRTRVE